MSKRTGESHGRHIAKFLGISTTPNSEKLRFLKQSEIADTSITAYDSIGALPVTNLSAGDQALIENKWYVSNGSGWYNVALFNATPRLTIDPTGTVVLATDGSTPTVITLTGTDSDNADANLVYSVESDGSFGGLATLSQDSSVFTITPLAEGSATTTSSTLTFKVSDGISFGSGTTTFSLTFGPDWSVTPTETKIIASDGAYDERFGRDTAISGNGLYAISGVYWENDNGNRAGAAYIFAKSGNTWSQQDKIFASDAQLESWFGESVAINSDGTYAVVGASQEDTNGVQAGAAYIYTRSGSTWTQQQKIVGTDTAGGDYFGSKVAINDDATYIAVGAPFENAVYIFTRSGSTWTQQAKCQPLDGPFNTQFGTSLEINSDGTYFITGDSSKTGGGAAYVFTRSGSTWTQQAKLVSSDLQASDYFGYDVALNSDATYAIVGAAFEDTGQSNAGAAYIFTRSGSTWTEQAKIQANDVTGNAYFGTGTSMNSSGDHVIIGASGLNTRIGSVYIFERSGSTWTQKVKLRGSDATTTYSDGGTKNVSMSDDGSTVIYAHYTQTVSSVLEIGAAYIFEVG